MLEWWESLATFEKIFWYIAIPFSVILLIQIILTFVGISGSSDDFDTHMPDSTDIDLDTDVTAESEFHDGGIHHDGIEVTDHGGLPFAVFTFRNFIAFFTVFGWAGITGIHADFPTFWTIVFATVLGIGMMFLISLLFYSIGKLVESGNMDIHNAINQVGNVYIPIKANRGNIGKIQVNIQDSLREMRAITKQDEDLPTGTVIKVIGIVSGNILVVKKFSE